MSDIRGHFCGQTQPHAAHVWQTPEVYGSATLIDQYQCGGYSPAPWIAHAEQEGE